MSPHDESVGSRDAGRPHAKEGRGVGDVRIEPDRGGGNSFAGLTGDADFGFIV